MSTERAKRDRGICRGSLWCQQKPLLPRSTSDSSKYLHYAVLVGGNMLMYETAVSYRRGDHPVSMVHIVGASAWNPSSSNNKFGIGSASSSSQGHSSASFRLVTEQGTHLYCAAPTSTCRDLWLGALHAGLDRSLLEKGIPKQQPLQPPAPAKTGRLRPRRLQKYCFSCGAMDEPDRNPIRVKCVPVPHYAKETRVDLCKNCLIAQGLLNDVYFLRELMASAQHERQAMTVAKQLCWNAMKQANPELEREVQEAASTMVSQEYDSSNADTTATTTTTTTTTGEATQEAASSSSSSSNSNGSSKDTSSWSIVDDPFQSQAWIHLPPTLETTKAVMKLITSSAEFLSLQRVSLTLENCCEQIQQGLLGVPDLLEQMENIIGSTAARGGVGDELAEMKKQAFRVAGDMGTAMKLLHDLALPRNLYQQQQQQHSKNLDMFVCLLEFLLDLCEGGELASVAAFWPQLCHIHLRMLPADNIADLQRIELLEDFLLTVATRYSIHLALDLVWSHTADLEESMTSPVCSPTCRRRRYAVLRFVCELESLLFGFPNGWGGGSVALGKLYTPSSHQDALIKLYMENIQELRKDVPQFLTRSVRMEIISHAKFEKDPEEAVREAMRVAKNADYFSSHLNFSKRLCDIAEKMFHLDVKERSDALEAELSLLNASGTLGGDPLNRVLEHHLRVVGVPPREGHVFRSKERTPVLLLMEVFDDTVEDDEEQQKTIEMREQSLSENNTADHHDDGGNASPISPSAEKKTANDEDDDDEFSDTQPAPPDLSENEEKFEDAKSGEEEDHSTSAASNPITNTSSLDEDEMYSPKHVRPIHAKFASPSRKAPALPLEGSLDDSGNSHAPHALKRFDRSKDETKDGPTTPNMETVEEMVTHAMVKQLRIPDLEVSKEGDEGDESGDEESAGEDSKREDTSDSKEDDDSGASANEKISKKRRDMRRIKSSDSALSLSDKGTPKRNLRRNKSGSSAVSDEGKRESKRMMSLNAADALGDCEHGFAPTGDVRREVLNHIFLRGIQGTNTIASGAQASVQQSLQELEHKRAVELLMHDTDADSTSDPSESYVEVERKKKMAELGLDEEDEGGLGKGSMHDEATSEEDEALEAIRLLLIQNRVAQGRMSPVAAAKVLQHASEQRGRTGSNGSADFSVEGKEMPKVDAGDVDPRLVGCGDLPPAVLQALTLWKAGMVTNGELLELVSKDLEHGRRMMCQDPEVVDKLMEDSAFWGRFAFGERWAEKKARIALKSVHGKRAGWDLVGVIVKSNDDLRQEKFVMQLIELCQEAFQVAGLELWVHPYRILATGRSTGMIEMVRNAMSFDGLKKRPGYGKGGLREHLQRMTEFMPDPVNAFKAAQRNFVRSLAAYSLMSYFFLFKDRHNGNILLDTAGHVIHIDFGFVFGIAPGGSFSLEMSAPFKFTQEMLDVMDGIESPFFSEFVILFCCGFLALQAHFETFLTLVEITSKESTFPCFEGKDSEEIVEKLRERFRPDLGTEKSIAFALDLIQQATSSYGTKQYDYFQYLSQGIAT